MIRLFSSALLALALPVPLLAQDAADPMVTARAAEATALQMAQVQEAVGMAQSQFSGMMSGNIGSNYRGAIALPGAADNSWLAIIIGQRGTGSDAPLVALAEYEIANGAILSEVIHLTRDAPLLDGTASAMAQARTFAPRAVLAAGHATFCAGDNTEGSGVTFSTIVLPPRADGTFDAYVLNGPIEDGAIPLGKHFRVGFDGFGLDGEPELVTDTCEVVTWDTARDDLAMSVYVTEYDGGNAPSAIHAFVSSLLPMSMGVVTGDMIWPMAGGAIAAPVPAAEAGYAPSE